MNNGALAMNELMSLNIPESAWVDFLQFFACNKPVVRTKMLDSQNISMLRLWCLKNNLSSVVDGDGYVFISHNEDIAKVALETDRATCTHTFEFGQILGYPRCCCEFISNYGEEKIDDIEIELLDWKFNNEHRLIDPKGYLSGTSLICHLPCSTHCSASLKLATKALNFIKVSRFYDFAGRWTYWLPS